MLSLIIFKFKLSVVITYQNGSLYNEGVVESGPRVPRFRLGPLLGYNDDMAIDMSNTVIPTTNKLKQLEFIHKYHYAFKFNYMHKRKAAF